MKNSFYLTVISILISSPAYAWNRIVTLNPMISEWTAEMLGQDKVFQKIVGASEYSHYPDFMKKVSTVGPYPQLQIEKILSLHPDLVIGSVEYNRADQLEKLKQLKLNVVVLPKENFHQMKEWLMELGKALNETEAAQKTALVWEKEMGTIKSHLKHKRVFFEVQFQPLITVGRDSFLTEAFQFAGFENIFDHIPQAYPKVSREAVLQKKPVNVFVLEMIKDPTELSKIKIAWKNSEVTFLNGDDFSRCSLRLLRALKELK